MSIKVISLVWDRFPGAGSELLCMLSLADWSDDDGGNLFPSVRRLAARMRLSRSQAQRVLHGLLPAATADGEWWVKVVGNETGGAPGSTRRLQLNLGRLKALPDVWTGRLDATGRTGARGRMDAQDGSHGCAETGRMDAALSVIEPSENRHIRERARDRTVDSDFETWWAGYPEKLAKGAARKAFDVARSKIGLDDLVEGVKRYVASKPKDRAWCHPATWLNQERWLDQPARPRQQQLLGDWAAEKLREGGGGVVVDH